MAETDASYNAGNEPPQDVTPTTHTDFPWERLLMSLAFAVVVWIGMQAALIAAVLVWVLVALKKEPHPEVKSVLTISTRYIHQCLSYLLMLSDEKPFPFGPLPRGD